MIAVVAAVTLTFVPYSWVAAQGAGAALADPQVFVKDATAQPGVGQEGIDHDAGLRPAQVSADPPTMPLFNARGAPLGVTIGQWMSAGGTLVIEPINASAQQVSISLHGLSRYGVYSVFVNRTPDSPGSDLPLDGAGTGNSVVADAGGTARVMLLVTPPLTTGSLITVVFHSDGASHAMSPGAPGVTAHVQLAATVKL
ncbi:MAG: hypothetical protein JO219_02930 [Candidatus Eremiobacteraeota bacterium]|nr:hypothetical protein [Candidatus Eremiobacteraeota bacterium]MBV8364863.1 hypothetical protein [Candidatus Eremiobacteraeota bacterium]